MLKVLYRTAAVAAIASLPFSASALGISVTEITTSVTTAQTDFQKQLDKLVYFTIEDFETKTVGQDEFSDKAIVTHVGTMTFSGAAGAGGAATFDKSFGRIAGAPAFGRQNTSTATFGGNGITAGAHSQYLESNDVQTMTWTAEDKSEGRQFDRLLFSITDAADSGAKFRISDGTGTSSFEYELGVFAGENGEIRNFVVSFADLQTSATVEFTNMTGAIANDGVGFDNMVVGAVPLPAAAWLLLGVSGALVAAKRRSARRDA